MNEQNERYRGAVVDADDLIWASLAAVANAEGWCFDGDMKFPAIELNFQRGEVIARWTTDDGDDSMWFERLEYQDLTMPRWSDRFNAKDLYRASVPFFGQGQVIVDVLQDGRYCLRGEAGLTLIRPLERRAVTT